ncbi:MAG TPA: triose-phosphate isomerase [Kiritimatiellia bacterium]|jgi:triosephosphate isomerase|nr:triose-phosphate isomerase [Lentisphaerota bacterium]HRV31408.1 triose-phosphate isomerase [Kiritimatiellia bacterium]
MRKKIVAGNWKMNMTTAEATALVNALKEDLANFRDVEVVLCPPFTALATVSELVHDTHLDLGAQNMHWAKSGAYTGEISAGMLRELYCHYVILGHSERRQYFGETDAIVNRKTQAALASSLHPIVCVGETLQEREAGKVEEVITTQVQGSLAGLSAKELLDSVIAYEPVWAIGTGKTATSDQAQEVHALIRQILTQAYDATVAQGVRIQYGGSVKPSNAKELFSMPDIDGGLIGGAALDAKSFIDIVRAAV